jgi:tRNA(adenine34) deaminase
LVFGAQPEQGEQGVGAVGLRPRAATGEPEIGSAAVDLHEAMGLALDEAQAAAGHDDVPVGAVVLHGDRVVARRHNERELSGDPTAHAEILALRDAAEAAGGWRLDGHTLVVTLEPCPMCAGALLAARIGRVVFGAVDPKAGACGSLYNLCADPRLNHEIEVVAGLRAGECARRLGEFFATRR